MKFTELGLNENILKAIDDLGYVEATEIQASAIPTLLNTQSDFVGQAQTGTGKTAAFVLPILERIKSGTTHIQALVLTPTRELANQVCEEVEKLAKYTKVNAVAIYGGASYDRQISALRRKKPQIIVGTPGRIMDLMKQKKLNFQNSDYLVLDEADEMLNMGFLDDVKTILGQFNKDRRMLMFSATMPKAIIDLIKIECQDPKIVTIAKKALSNENIEQTFYVVKRRNQKEALCRILDAEENMYGIVFCRTRLDTKNLADELLGRGYSVESLHGEMGQQQRDLAMSRFKNRKAKLMICTDVAARGIDVTNLSHVINFGFPQDNESYVHRIGRTGRAGEKGIALTLVDPNEVYLIKRMERFINCSIAHKKLPTVSELKSSLVNKEIENMSSILEAVLGKGGDYKLDATFDEFKKSLDSLDKEEALKVMFSWHFSRTLRNYDNIGELDEDMNRSARGPGPREARGGRSRNDRRGGRSERSGAGASAATGSRNRGRRGTGPSKGNVRLFMNMGKDDGLNLQSLLDDMSKAGGMKKQDICNVDMKGKFSFLEVPTQYESKVLGLKDLKVKDRRVRLEVSQ